MSHLTITNLGNEIVGTYNDGKYKFVVTQKISDNFLFDCACIIDSISMKIYEFDKKEKGKNGII